MKTVIVRENLKPVGKITTYNNGDKIARRMDNTTVWKYNSSMNTYRDSSGKRIK